MSASGENAFDVLRQLLRNHMNDRADHLAGNGANSFPEYTHITGVIEGLAIAERELLDLKRQIEKA